MTDDSPAAVLVDPVSENSAKYFALGADYVPGVHGVLYDASGNPYALILDNSIYRLEARSTICGQVAGSGSEVKVTTIADTEDTNQKRLQTESRLAPGSKVNIGTAVPANPASLVVEFLKNGGSENLLVNGATTPVVFEYAPAAGEIVALDSLIFVFSADDIYFDGSKFGSITGLAPGIQIKLDLDVVTTIFTVAINEDFLRIPGPPPIVNNTGPKDFLEASFSFGGLIKLHGDDSDKVTVTINDNLTDVRLKYLTATLYGVEE